MTIIDLFTDTNCKMLISMMDLLLISLLVVKFNVNICLDGNIRHM